MDKPIIWFKLPKQRFDDAIATNQFVDVLKQIIIHVLSKTYHDFEWQNDVVDDLGKNEIKVTLPENLDIEAIGNELHQTLSTYTFIVNDRKFGGS